MIGGPLIGGPLIGGPLIGGPLIGGQADFDLGNLDRVVGVIDLLGGNAVHAVAGIRKDYKPVRFCDGDPFALMNHYLKLGIRAFYLADLDSIAGKPPSFNLLAQLCDQCVGPDLMIDLMVDCGISGGGWIKNVSPLTQFAESCPSVRTVRWIAATESLHGIDAVRECARALNCSRLVLSLDYQNGALLGTEPQVESWIQAALDVGIQDFIVLDLAAVGQSCGPVTAAICRRIRESIPHGIIYSGGGVNSSEDIAALHSAGCDHFLVATALHPKS